MKLIAAAWIALAAIGICVFAAPFSAQDPNESIELGKKVYSQRCVNCHFVPDATIERDRVWTELIKTTA